MKVNELFADCKLIEINKISDNRGYFRRMSENTWLPKSQSLKQISISMNEETHTLRGMHYQKSLDSEWKIVNVIAGAIYDVVIDLRTNSETYLDHWAEEISDSNPKALIISPGFAHGFMTLSPKTIVHYSLSQEFDAQNYCGVPWNDPRLQIEWPFYPSKISEQDKQWNAI
jgi:dTDP-4-dehydrorhamnose 3,5-epimerase